MKKIIIEALVFIGIIFTIFIGFSMLFYKDMPTNKIVPETVEYALPSNLQEELDNTLEEEEEQEVVVTYTVTEQDMDEYEDNDSYNPGKINPFAVYTENEEATDVSTSGNNTNNQNSTTTNNNNSNNNKNNKNSSNSSSTLFEDSNTK